MTRANGKLGKDERLVTERGQCWAAIYLTYPEVGRAGREDDPVRLDELPLGAEGDVDEGLLLEQRVEHGEDGRAVVVPLQAELLLGSRPCRSRPCWRQKLLFKDYY